MKKTLVLLFTVGVVLGGLATANAQELKVAVPFDFVVNGATLPAATYSIRESLPFSNSGLEFIGDRTGIFATAVDVDTTAPGAKLAFHRIGDQYFLSDVVTPTGTRHFAVSDREAELSRSLNQQAASTIIGD
jgi:hypothetical protein